MIKCYNVSSAACCCPVTSFLPRSPTGHTLGSLTCNSCSFKQENDVFFRLMQLRSRPGNALHLSALWWYAIFLISEKWTSLTNANSRLIVKTVMWSFNTALIYMPCSYTFIFGVREFAVICYTDQSDLLMKRSWVVEAHIVAFPVATVQYAWIMKCALGMRGSADHA